MKMKINYISAVLALMAVTNNDVEAVTVMYRPPVYPENMPPPAEKPMNDEDLTVTEQSINEAEKEFHQTIVAPKRE